jgi:hypothetical protein
MATVVIAETLDTVTVSRVQLPAAASDTTWLTKMKMIGRGTTIVDRPTHTKLYRPWPTSLWRHAELRCGNVGAATEATVSCVRTKRMNVESQPIPFIAAILSETFY